MSNIRKADRLFRIAKNHYIVIPILPNIDLRVLISAMICLIYLTYVKQKTSLMVKTKQCLSLFIAQTFIYSVLVQF